MSKQQNKSPVVVAIVSDIHAGSTIGLSPPRVALDDGGEYRASKAQQWLWRNWREYIVRVRAKAKYLNAPLVTVFNGDLTDGDHHRTVQVITSSETEHIRIANEIISPLTEQAAAIYVIRGTEVHVGPNASLEEKLAEDISAVRDEGGAWSSWHRQLDINGVVFDFAHHGSLGRQPWTKANAVNRIAASVLYEAGRNGHKPPHLVIRSHLHQYADSYTNHAPTRVISTPGWQLASAYIHRIAPGALADIGGLIVACWPGGRYEVEVVQFKPDKRRPEKVKL